MLREQWKEEKINAAYEYNKFMRMTALEMAKRAGQSGTHIGGGFSAMEIIAVLYGAIMKYDKNNPVWDNRDRFITSKRHCYLASYSALYKAGFITKEQLFTYHDNGGLLAGYPWNPELGLDFSGGSLGMGLSVGIGMALTAKRYQKDYNTFVLLGDGECNEGMVWEAFMAASKFNLDHLIAIIDYNHMQFDGENDKIMSVAPLFDKLKAFGWEVVEVNGHSIEELYAAFSTYHRDKPLAVIADTIKAYGLPGLENKAESHHAILKDEDCQYMIKMIEEGKYDRV